MPPLHLAHTSLTSYAAAVRRALSATQLCFVEMPPMDLNLCTFPTIPTAPLPTAAAAAADAAAAAAAAAAADDDDDDRTARGGEGRVGGARRRRG